MSSHAAFRRQPVPGQVAQNLQTITIPAPTRGLIQSENEAFMQPGGAIVQDNWAPTMRGVRLRGGCVRWCELPETAPVISSFEYSSGGTYRMYAANDTKLYDVTSPTPVLIASGRESGNYASARMFNMGGDYMVVVNDAGDHVLRTKDGVTWVTLTGATTGTAADGASHIYYKADAVPAGIPQGKGLVYVWTYRNRLFFIQQNSMTAWYLKDVNAAGGELLPLYLAGAAEKGGKLLFGATWSIDAGDGTDDKCVFATDLGELLIFTGSDPSDVTNWRQEGRYAVSTPLGMNAHMLLGGDLLIMTHDGIVPVSQAINKDSGALALAMITRNIKTLWRQEVATKRQLPWTMKKWDEYGAIFVTTPGGTSPATRHCLMANNETGAWARFTWDATCWLRLRADMFFGTPNGIIMQMDRTGYDDGLPYTCTLVGGWELFGSGSNQVVWHQARAVFITGVGQQFKVQLAAATDYVVKIPPPPPVLGTNVETLDVWDQGLWGPGGSGNIVPVPPADKAAYAQYDQPVPAGGTVRNTLWISIGRTGFAHAPIVQIQVGQAPRPNVELIAIATTQERGGTNV